MINPLAFLAPLRAAVEPASAASHPQGVASVQPSIDDLCELGLSGTLPARQMAVVLNALRATDGPPAGEIELRATQNALDYIETGTPPEGIAMQSPMSVLPGPERTRAERAIALLERCQAALSGPAANLLAVGGRTGAIVAMSVALRETIAYYLEQALQSNDVSEANRAWLTAGVFMVGPCLNLLGLLREEWQGSATFRSRIGRSSMLCLTLASGLAVALQGGLARMTSATVAGTLYAVVRDIANTCFPLNSNVSEFRLAPTAAAAGAYGAFGGLLEWMAPYLPASGQTGASGAAQGLGYDLFGTLLHSLGSVLSAVQDDLTLLGLHANQADVENPEPLSIQVASRWPGLSDLVGAVTQQGALRSSALHTINFAVAGVLMGIADGDEPHENSQAIGTSVVAFMLMAIYIPFVYALLTRAVPEPEVQTTRL